MAAVSPVGRAVGLEPIGLHAGTHTAGTLYEHHSRRVFAYCLSRLGRREDAEDAVQTTFLHAVRGLRRGVVPSVELAWLLGIARNVCLTRRESAGRRGRLELVSDPGDLERAPAPQGRADELIGLEDALARLPEQQRRAVLLRDWRGLSYQEVADQLGVSLANAETLIFRGRRTLAGLLREEPAATRRRLASLGNLGSLLAWTKSAFTGATAIAKVAAVASAVAVSGTVSATVIEAGTTTSEPSAGAPVRPVRTIQPSSAPPVAEPAASPRPAVPAPVPEASAAASASGAAPAAPPRSTPTAAPAATPATPSDNAPAAAPSGTGKPALLAGPSVRPAVAKPDPSVPVTAPALPVALPPVGEAFVDAVSPVTVAPPPAVPVEPITIDPGALLP